MAVFDRSGLGKNETPYGTNLDTPLAGAYQRPAPQIKRSTPARATLGPAGTPAAGITGQNITPLFVHGPGTVIAADTTTCTVAAYDWPVMTVIAYDYEP